MNPLTILQGDCRDTLKGIPDGMVQICVTSPPYWGLRSYLAKGHASKHLEIGAEKTPEEYVETMVSVMREVRRCLHESGTLWLNIGDSYAGSGKGPTGKNGIGDQGERQGFINAFRPGSRRADGILDSEGRRNRNGIGPVQGIKPKDLCLIPWRVAIALQADGWWVRSIIAWHKKSCMPESVTDRPTSSWEPIFLLTKSADYFYDAEAVKEPSSDPEGSAERYKASFGGAKNKELKDSGQVDTRPIGKRDTFNGTRNQRNVWTLSPDPCRDAHFAVFPREIPRRAILAGTSAKGCCPKCFAPWERIVKSSKEFKGGSGRAGNIPSGKQNLRASETNSTPDVRMGPVVTTTTTGWRPTCKCGETSVIPCTVLDPFGGSGTTGAVAVELGRRAILCELNDAYLPIINQRTRVTIGLQLT